MNEEKSPSLKHYSKKIVVLLACDALLLYGSMFFASSNGVFSITYALHGVFVIWVGLILHWISKVKELKNSYTLALYWVAFALTFMVGSFFLPVLWLIAAMIIARDSRESDLNAALATEDPISLDKKHEVAVKSHKRSGSIWPLYISILLAIGILVQTVIMIGFDPSEFGALGMLFVAMFTAPFFLVVPGLLRIFAAAEIKKSVIFVQYMIYVMLAISWLIFIMRSSS